MFEFGGELEGGVKTNLKLDPWTKKAIFGMDGAFIECQVIKTFALNDRKFEHK
jgi:hypothetical protein